MALHHSFNPYIVHINQGRLHNVKILSERMCLWYELEMLYDGGPDAGVITLDQFIPVRRGVLFLRRPGDIVRGISPYSYTCILFDPCYDPDFADYYELKGRSLSHDVDIPFLQKFTANGRRSFDFLESIPRIMHFEHDADALKPIFQIADLARSHSPGQQLLAKAKLTEFLLALSSQGEVAETPYVPRPNAVTVAQKFMSQNYSKKLTLEMVASHVSLNREYFCRLFARYAGTTPIAYLQQVRIYHAKLMLMSETASIEAVALSCGFQNISYFFSVFKKYTGMTPTEYRNHQSQKS